MDGAGGLTPPWPWYLYVQFLLGGSAPGTVATQVCRFIWTLVDPSMRYQSTADPYGDS